ncbi:methylated-DNA--[protein]-cysteine S-methyltransferase, partial [Candidatus Gracilibacteria bacterium]|nr:methylated-DNA--[protein]-cysteine S-methyltransferase [Candidatus Gracilibacteria bacterium]
EAHLDAPLTLEQLGAHVALSPTHLQRIFTGMLGVSPREYTDALRMEQLKQRLRAGEDVSGALYSAGYGSSSRLYERADSQLGMTPNTYKRGGKGMQISYTSAPTALGLALVASTERGICAIYLGDDEAQLAADLHKEYPAAAIVRDQGELGAAVSTVQQYLDGEQPNMQLPLDVQATAFQRRVWQALQSIPYGETRTYGQIAAELGNANAVRAVGRACATNPVSLIVPCHRAVGSDGKLHGYRWGLARKQALLDLERGGGRRALFGVTHRADLRRLRQIALRAASPLQTSPKVGAHYAEQPVVMLLNPIPSSATSSAITLSNPFVSLLLAQG